MRPQLPGSAGPLLIRGADLVTVDPDLGEVGNADISVRDGRIAAIGPQLPVADAEIVDARGMIAIPGLVDGHRHLWEGLIRNSLPDGDLHDYLRVVNGAFAPAYGPEDAYLGELLTAVGAIDAGVTTVLDWSHVQTSPAHTDAILDALRDSGLRAVFAFGPPGAPDRGHRWPHDVTRLCADLAGDERITVALATFSPEHQPYEQAREHFSLARDAGALITVHAGLSGMGDADQIERFGRNHLLGPDVNLVHCNTLSDTEWKLIADTGTSVSITPSTEMQMGQGRPPIQAAMGVGLLPSVGVDVEVSAPVDMWTQLRLLFALQRSQVFAQRHDGQAAPRLLTTAELLRCATTSGATACGLADRVGSLRVGKEADIVLLRGDTVHASPLNDLTSAVIHNMDARNVDTVMVAGRVLKRGGQLVGIDVPHLLERARAARDRVFAAAQIDVPSARF